MPQSQQSSPPASAETNPYLIHMLGVLLFLFIPLVLFLFLRFPLNVLPSFGIAVAIMLAHRYVAIPFMHRYREQRCLWCGRTARPREIIEIQAGVPLPFQFCKQGCSKRARRFFDFVYTRRNLFRAGIFLPLAWYVITMTLNAIHVLQFPVDWNQFIFQFFIACSVVSISFLHGFGRETHQPIFTFPIHNLFLLGIRNTLLVFRYVGIWWIVAGIYFLVTKMS